VTPLKNLTRPIAWSFSRLDGFEQCPKKLNEISIKKLVPFKQSDAMKQGEIVHRMLEDRISKGTPFPVGYDHLEKVVAPILAVASEGQCFTELALAWDKNFNSCGYKDWDNCWLRVSYDFAFLRGDTLCIFDWKTGNVDFKALQLQLYAATAFLAFPAVEKVVTAFVWLKPGIVDPMIYLRSQLPVLWDEILPRVQKLQDANALDIWPATPNKYCRWCEVNKAGRCDEGRGRR
jgi:hypothetical protein